MFLLSKRATGWFENKIVSMSQEIVIPKGSIVSPVDPAKFNYNQDTVKVNVHDMVQARLQGQAPRYCAEFRCICSDLNMLCRLSRLL